MTLTYSSYLKLEQLLNLQEPQSTPPEHDEMLFIVIHQVYELWFKLLMHELDAVKRHLSDGNLFASIHTFKRCRTIMKTLVGQLDILETMTPMSFAGFRHRLDTASGFQSAQFRELEFLLGYKRAEMIRLLPEDAPRLAAVKRRLGERGVVDHFYDFLEHRGAKIPREQRGRDVTQANPPDERVQKELLRLYKAQPDAAILFELMTDFDEGFQEWKYRHVKLVERTIGEKHGTGGTLGVEWLKKTLFIPVFADLWAVRRKL